MSEHDEGYKLVISIKKLRYGRLLTSRGCGCAVGQILWQLTPRGRKKEMQELIEDRSMLTASLLQPIQRDFPGVYRALLSLKLIEEWTGKPRHTPLCRSIYGASDSIKETGTTADSKATGLRNLTYLLNCTTATKTSVID